LRMGAFEESGDGQHLGGRNHALPTSAMDADLKNVYLPTPA